MKFYDTKMKLFSSIILSLYAVMGFSQTILYQAESTSRTVQDPQSVILTEGFYASSSSSNPFIAKIGPATENPGGGPSDSNAGATNPSGTTAPTGKSFHDTKGNIEVNGAGQLQFTLPIALPPGVKSVAPQVSLVYTSGSGNGIAGYSWNISGISSISRVGKNIEKDGKIESIQYNSSDYYSFNGQRLILKSGEYGKDGAEYFTEKYSNIKIRSIGSIMLDFQTTDVPEYWEVTFEDGSQAWYGVGNGKTLNEYNITKWKDAQGNYITYEYDRESIGGGCNINVITGQLDCTIATDTNISILKKISWGGNEILNKPHFNEILFNYKERDLKEFVYNSGRSFFQIKILDYIIVNTNGSQFKKYTIDYNKLGTNYQFVNKITEYNSSNEPANPITIEYKSDSQVNGIFKQDSRYDDIAGAKISGDFNGDGKLDFIKGNTLMLGRLDGTGQFVNISYTGTPLSVGSYVKNNVVLDRQVFFTIEAAPAKKYKVNTYLFDNNNNFSLIDSKLYDYSAYNVLNEDPTKRYDSLFYGQEADFNGDGSSDTVFSVLKTGCPSQNAYCGILVPGSTSEVQYFYIDHLNNQIKLLDMPVIGNTNIDSRFDQIGDFNGNGKTDLLQIYGTTIKIFELDNQDHFTEIFSTPLESMETMYLGDFNGDGKTDIISPMADDSSDWRMYISTGKGFIKHYYSNLFLFQRSWQGSPRKNRNIQRTYTAPDLNKDGKSDFMIFESQVWFRDGWSDWNNPDSSYGINYLRNEGVDSTGKPIFTNAYNISPVELNIESETLNFSMYGEHYTPIVGSFRVSQLNTELVILHKNTLTTWDFGNKLNTISRIKSITQGGLKTDVEYAVLANDGNIYKSYLTTSPVNYPYVSVKENLTYDVVSKLIQGERKQEFRYRDLIGHLHGKGMIGFRQTAKSTFFANGFENTKVWSGSEINPTNEGLPYKDWSIRTTDENKIFPTDISLSNNQLLSFKQYDYKIDKLLNGTVVTTVADVDKPKIVMSINPYITTSKDFLKNIKTVHTVEQYNEIYLPKKSVTVVNDGVATSISELEYYPSILTPGTNYSIGKPKVKTETIQAYGDTKIGKEEYVYENNLLKSSKTWNRDNTEYILEINNYDGFGNVIQKTISNSIDSQTKTTLIDYDNKGRFAVKKTDELGLSNIIVYNDWGQILSQTDPFGNILSNTYDGWGKLIKSKTNLGGTTTYEYAKDSEFNTLVTQYDPNNAVSKKYTNILGQVYKSSTKAFGQGQFISTDIQYDVLGRKIKESEPYFEGQNASQWNTIAYDDSVFPAKITITAFNGKKQETSIVGTTTTQKELNGYGRTTSKTTDALGNVVSSTDKGGTIQFSYNAAGEQIKAQYAENIVTTKYDSWGRKSEFNDPSNGLYKYEYDGFGQPKKIISPKGTKEYTYNNLGQLITQTELSTTDGGQATNKIISFAYDGKGRVISKSGTSNGKTYSSNVTYDPQGRLISASESSNGKYFIQKGITYDDKARVISYEKQLYSSGVLTKVQIENVYKDWNGELYQVKDKVSGKVLWELKETNVKGKVLKARLGAVDINNTYDNNDLLSSVNHSSAVKPSILQISYSFDALKNELKSRTTGGDFNIVESFDYDDNNRLINWTDPITGIMPTANRNIYDIKGRITQNDQVGTIKFENSSKIYQPTGMTLNAAGTQNYNNDLIQSIVYNENNDPVFIDGEKGDVAFQYGLTSMRQRVTYGGNFSTDGEGKFTKFYSEDSSFEVLKDNITGKEKHIIYIGGSPYESSIIYMKNFDDSNGSYKFLHKDYLGSVLAISDEIGNKLEQRHFDAWGNFTHLQMGNGAIITDKNIINNASLLIDRGYTSHEHFAEVGIIHMNGRLYDPLLRRFLNADENIQYPYNTQNYNKYGYVLNNPLLFNDPTGEIMGWDDAIIAIGIAIITSVATDYYMNRPVNVGNMVQSLSMTLMSMGVTSGIGDAFRVGGEVVKALGKTGSIIARAGAHALAQGTLSYVQGGKFWSGALSGAFASVSGDLLGLAKNTSGEFSVIRSDGFAMLTGAIAGGVGSVLVDGNFWTGAAQGLVVTVFNHLALHEPPTGYNENYFADETGEYYKISDYLYEHRVDGKIVETKFISGILLKTKFNVAREWFSAISKTGNLITTIGLGLTASVIGAEIGVPLLAIGNGIRLAGDIAYTLSYAVEGNYDKAFTSGTEVAASYIVSRYTGKALSTTGIGQQELASKGAKAVAEEINGRMVTDVAAPVIKQEIKTTKYKIKTVN